MTAQDHLGPVLHQILDRGHRGADPGVVGDLLVLVQGHVEIHAHEHPLPLEIRLLEIAHALLHRHFEDRTKSM